jgi:hypothetical protein
MRINLSECDALVCVDRRRVAKVAVTAFAIAAFGAAGLSGALAKHGADDGVFASGGSGGSGVWDDSVASGGSGVWDDDWTVASGGSGSGVWDDDWFGGSGGHGWDD